MTERLLAGHVALVTGGSRGLGAATCRRLAEHGAAIVVNYKSNHEAAKSVVEAITVAGGRAVTACADITQEKSVRAMVAQAEQELGSIDILVNNAWPGFRGGAIEDLQWDTYQWYMDQIVQAAYHTVRAVLPAMRERRWGRIVNIGTTSLYELNGRHTPYIAAKGALLAMTRGLARDLGPENICVNMITPGLIYTGEGRPPPDWGPVHAGRSALNRNATAWEVAGAVVFLASPLADVVTGAQLPACSGLVMNLG